MHRLLADADIFLTNTRPKALERLGLDYASQMCIRDRLLATRQRWPGSGIWFMAERER